MRFLPSVCEERQSKRVLVTKAAVVSTALLLAQAHGIIAACPACVAPSRKRRLRFGKTQTRHIPSTLPSGRAPAAIRNSRTKSPLVKSPKLSDFDTEVSDAIARWRANALRSFISDESPGCVILWTGGHAYVLPPYPEETEEVRTPKLEDFIQMDIELTLELCKIQRSI